MIALEAHHTEREIDMLGLFAAALRRHPAPDVLYLDNGSTYRGHTLQIACERIGTLLLHPGPGDAPARGKMERFWRSLRQAVLDFLGDVASLHDVNVRLLAFLDQHYHQAPHGGLMGRAPGVVCAEGLDPDRAPVAEDKLAEALIIDMSHDAQAPRWTSPTWRQPVTEGMAIARRERRRINGRERLHSATVPSASIPPTHSSASSTSAAQASAFRCQATDGRKSTHMRFSSTHLMGATNTPRGAGRRRRVEWRQGGSRHVERCPRL